MPNYSPSLAATAPPSREKLIEAAARVYAAHGFRGATTRRIAVEAGVNEVTIFRLFGSKTALIDEALRRSTSAPTEAGAALPDVPRQPQRELTAWCVSQLAALRERRALIRTSMGEADERPEALPCAAAVPTGAAAELKRYMCELYRLGFVENGRRTRGRGGRDEEAHAAGAMLIAALFGDAMARDFMPEMYPQPASRAPALYVRLFLRAIRCRPTANPRRTPSRG